MHSRIQPHPCSICTPTSHARSKPCRFTPSDTIVGTNSHPYMVGRCSSLLPQAYNGTCRALHAACSRQTRLHSITDHPPAGMPACAPMMHSVRPRCTCTGGSAAGASTCSCSTLHCPWWASASTCTNTCPPCIPWPATFCKDPSVIHCSCAAWHQPCALHHLSYIACTACIEPFTQVPLLHIAQHHCSAGFSGPTHRRSAPPCHVLLNLLPATRGMHRMLPTHHSVPAPAPGCLAGSYLAAALQATRW